MEQTLQGIYLLLTQNGFIDNNNIFRSYQNEGSVSPDNFIIFQIIGKSIKSTPVYKDDVINNKITYKNIAVLSVQADFYGELALDAVSQIEAYVNSRAANDYFKQNNILLSTYNNEQVQNLTGILDNKNYVSRYVLRFNLFSNYDLTVDQDYFDETEFNDNFTIYYVQNNTVIPNK